MFTFSNLFTNINVASYIQDSRGFHINRKSNPIMFSGYSKIGSICDIDVSIDPYLNFNDNLICLFDRVELNVKNIVASEVIYPLEINTRAKIDFDFDFNVGDSVLLYVILGNDKIFNEWTSRSKSLNRDIKINDILGN
jgi:hypothetical protein